MDFDFRIFLYIIIIMSAVFHEFSHALMADSLGDPTAKLMGRLTLNPFKHMDLFGTVLLPLFLLFFTGGFIGWAKPVPYNPSNLSDQKFGSAKVALAGPVSNLIIAIAFGIILRIFSSDSLYMIAMSWVIYINIFLALFNLIPIPPLDGSKVLMDLFPGSRSFMMGLSAFGIIFAVILALFFLPAVSSFLYFVITGQNFMPFRF